MKLKSIPLLLLLATALAPTIACGGDTAAPLPTYTPYPTQVPSIPVISANGAEDIVKNYLLSCLDEAGSEYWETDDEEEWWYTAAREGYLLQQPEGWRAEFESSDESGESWIVTGLGFKPMEERKIGRTEGVWRIRAGQRVPEALDGAALYALHQFQVVGGTC